MKTISILIAVFAISVAAQNVAAQSANFSGTWLLDAKQKGLPPHYKSVESHRLDIKHSNDALTVDIEIKSAGETEPFRVTAPYRLDGSETKMDMPIRTPKGRQMVPTTLTASQSTDGKMTVTVVHEIVMGEKTIKGGMLEEWQLSKDGKSILIHLIRDTPQGKIEYDMVFVRQ